MNQKPWRRKIILVLLVTLASGGLWGGYRLYYTLGTVIPDAYCVWHVAGLVIDYMEDHNGEWPQGWDDLRKMYDKSDTHAWSFKELQARVSVNWNADPEKLVATILTEGKPPFRVIWTNSESNSHWESREPNRLILEYLLKRKNKAGEDPPESSSTRTGDP